MRTSLFAALALLTGCPARGTPRPAHPTAGARPSGTLVSLQRDRCFGTCPAYRLDIDTDGTVRYEGRANVCKDEATERLPPAKLADLRTAIGRSRFASIPEHCCDEPCSDTSLLTVTVADPPPARTLLDSDCYSRPTPIQDLANAIEKIVDIEHWIGTDEERSHCTF